MPFSALPGTVQEHIWQLTWDPRVVSFGDSINAAPLPAFACPTSAHVNRTARKQTLKHYELVETRRAGSGTGAGKRRAVDVRVNYALDTVRLYPGLGAFPEIDGLDTSRVERLVSVSYQLCGTSGPSSSHSSSPSSSGRQYETYREYAKLFAQEPSTARLHPDLFGAFESLEHVWVTTYDLKDLRRGGSDAWWEWKRAREPGGRPEEGPEEVELEKGELAEKGLKGGATVGGEPQRFVDYRYAPLTGNVETASLSESSELAIILEASGGFWTDAPDVLPELVARVQVVRGRTRKAGSQGGGDSLRRWTPVTPFRLGESEKEVEDRLGWRLVATELAAFVGEGPGFWSEG